MSHLAYTCQSNQWCRNAFYRQVDLDVEQEVRALSPRQVIDQSALREHAIGMILTYAIPAGNA